MSSEKEFHKAGLESNFSVNRSTLWNKIKELFIQSKQQLPTFLSEHFSSQSELPAFINLPQTITITNTQLEISLRKFQTKAQRYIIDSVKKHTASLIATNNPIERSQIRFDREKNFLFESSQDIVEDEKGNPFFLKFRKENINKSSLSKNSDLPYGYTKHSIRIAIHSHPYNQAPTPEDIIVFLHNSNLRDMIVSTPFGNFLMVKSKESKVTTDALSYSDITQTVTNFEYQTQFRDILNKANIGSYVKRTQSDEFNGTDYTNQEGLNVYVLSLLIVICREFNLGIYFAPINNSSIFKRVSKLSDVYHEIQ